MTRITSIRARGIKIPLSAPTFLSSRQVYDRHYGVLEITGDDGQTGIGFCYVGSSGSALFPKVVQELFVGMLLGQDAHRTEGLWEEMAQESLLQGRTGITMRVISAIDTALWDRNARASGLPLYKYLGASASGNVPAYASGGYYLEGKTPDLLADEMASYVAAGFDAVKIKVGRESLAQEEARLAAVRERIGPQTLLMLDANNAWRDLPNALRFMRMAERFDPYFIEEPFGPEDIGNHAALARATRVPVATGEIEVGRWRFKQLLDQGGAVMLQTDACVCGGITEFRRIAAMAAGYGVTMYPHWFHDLHVHLVASTPNARYVEFFPDDKVLNFRRLLDRQLVCERGRLLLPEGPGLGFGFLPEALEQFATTPWSD